jgi:hypothetical protein
VAAGRELRELGARGWPAAWGRPTGKERGRFGPGSLGQGHEEGWRWASGCWAELGLIPRANSDKT